MTWGLNEIQDLFSVVEHSREVSVLNSSPPGITSDFFQCHQQLGWRCQNVCLGGGGVRAAGDFVLLQSMKGQAASGLFRSAFIHLSPTLGARHRQSWGRGHGGAVGFGFKAQRRPRKRSSVWLHYRAKYKHPKRSLSCQFQPALQATGPHSFSLRLLKTF